MGNVSLTWIFISLAAFVTVFIIGTQGYTSFTYENNGTIDSEFLQKYQAINNYNQTLQVHETTTFGDFISSIPQTISSVVQTVFNIGLGAIFSLLNGTRVGIDITQLVRQEYPQIDWVFWFAVFAISIYLGSRYLQSARGQTVEN